MIVVILILDVSTQSRTVTTAILVLTTLVTTSKDACTPPPITPMVTSVRSGHVSPPLAVSLLCMYVMITILHNQHRDSIMAKNDTCPSPSDSLTGCVFTPFSCNDGDVMTETAPIHWCVQLRSLYRRFFIDNPSHSFLLKHVGKIISLKIGTIVKEDILEELATIVMPAHKPLAMGPPDALTQR